MELNKRNAKQRSKTIFYQFSFWEEDSFSNVSKLNGNFKKLRSLSAI
jgi:hypothetical protein